MFVQSDAEPYRFAVEPAEIELGVLRPDEDAHCAFEIVNLDARPLKIVHIDGSCECMGFEWRPGDVAPGERRRVSTTIRAENRGNKQLAAFVQANDRVVTTHGVSIRYSVVPELRFEPPRADFGQRRLGSDGRVDVVASYELPAGVAPLALTAVPAPGLDVPLALEWSGPERVELPGGISRISQRLAVRLDAGAILEPFRGELLFEGEGHRKARLPVTGAVRGDAWLDPAEVHLGIAEVGKPRRGQARLRFAGPDAAIASITSSDPALAVQVQPEKGTNSQRLQLTLEATVAGEFDGEVRIEIISAPAPLLLRVRARVR